MFSGSWDATAVREALGDNMGVAALPTYTLDGEEKQMYSYAGPKLWESMHRVNICFPQ